MSVQSFDKQPGAASPSATEEVLKPNANKGYLFCKRAFDILAAVLGLIICLIPMLIVGVLIYIESPGPVIFKQERLGKNEVPFMMYKFRSMYLDAEKGRPQWAEKDDPRCTRIGKVIRLWHIDELPQLFNILKGDMTIVGPRPERACFYDEFEKTVPGFRRRLLVKQGLTGLAQLNGGYDATPAEKLFYDEKYIRTQSLWLDLVCMVKTVSVIFSHKGAR